MVELYETSPAGAELPLEIGTVSVREVQTSMHLLAPYRGQAVQAAAAFNTQMGLEWPGPNELKRKGGVYVFWFDHAHIAVMGATPSSRLARHAAVRDVGDGWTVLELNGADVRACSGPSHPFGFATETVQSGYEPAQFFDAYAGGHLLPGQVSVSRHGVPLHDANPAA